MLSADPAGARRFAALRAQLAPLAPAQAAPALRELASRVRRDDLKDALAASRIARQALLSCEHPAGL